MYNITIQYLYILEMIITIISLVNTHHYMFSFINVSYSMRSFQIYSTVILFTRVTILYISTLWLTYFITGSLYILSPFTHFAQPTNLFFVYMSLFSFYLQMPLVSEITRYLSLSVWLISHGIISPRSIHLVANCKISFVLWVTVHCVYSSFLYLLFCW